MGVFFFSPPRAANLCGSKSSVSRKCPPGGGRGGGIKPPLWDREDVRGIARVPLCALNCESTSALEPRPPMRHRRAPRRLVADLQAPLATVFFLLLARRRNRRWSRDQNKGRSALWNERPWEWYTAITAAPLDWHHQSLSAVAHRWRIFAEVEPGVSCAP